MCRKNMFLKKIGLLLTAVLLLLPNVSFAASTMQAFIAESLTFIDSVLLPLLFSVAFLYLLINMVRYFIIGGANEGSREKAKRNALYGIGGFIFLFILWGVISVLVTGLGITAQQSDCPDYVKRTGGCKTITGGTINGNTFTPNVTSGGGVYTGGSGSTGTDTSNTDTRSPNTSQPPENTIHSNLSELIFGTGTDSAQFSTHAGAPRAAVNTPVVSQTATCLNGLNTLRLASRAETNQAAYVVYKNTAGAVRWKNITDVHNTNHIGYDKDVVETIVNSGATDVYIVHTHPQKRITDQQLTADGHGPSAADMEAMCSVNNPAIKYLTIDQTGVWELQQKADTCPYNTTARAVLPILETYTALGTLTASDRVGELDRYQKSANTPSAYRNHFTNISLPDLQTLSLPQIIARTSGYQTVANINLAPRHTVEHFCSQY